MPKKLTHKKIVLILIASILCAFALLFYVYHEWRTYEIQKQQEANALATTTLAKDAFKDISLQAKAVYVYDIQTKKVLFEKNAEVPLPLASLTKIMTAIVGAEHLNPNTNVTIDSKALQEEGDSGLKEGEKWTVENLLSYMLIVSSNDGAQSIAEVFDAIKGSSTPTFVDVMNQKAQSLGLSTMHFSNPTGLDNTEETIAGATGSAKDVATLLTYGVAHHPDIFGYTKYAEKKISSESISHTAKNTDTVVNDIPNMIASKTGYTDLAGGNLAVVFDRGLNDPVVIVVLGSTYDDRFNDVLSLASSTIQTYNGAK